MKYALKNKYDYAAMLHGDNQYDPKYLSNMINLMTGKDKYDAIVGSRLMNKKSALKGNMPLYKYLGNIFLSTYFNFFFNTKFTDCHTGYWMYRCSKIKSLYLKCDNKFCFDLDLRLQIVEKKKKIKEIAIRTFYGSERSSIHFIYAIRFFYKVIKFKLFKKI
ncbi:MAG: glycosyltransferase [Candidatus Pelagibacter sp.]